MAPLRVNRLALASYLALLAAGCTVSNPAAGGSDGTGTGGGSTGPSATSGASTTTGADMGPTMCEPMNVCMSDAPASWLGPFAVVEGTGDMPPACPEGWGQELLVAWADLMVPASTCECACEAPEGASCGASNLVQSSAGNCTILTKAWSVDEACTALSGKDGQADNWTALQPDVVGGSCTPTPTAQIPAPTWAKGVVGCAPMDEAGACADADQSCVGLPDASSRLCVAAEGDVACPPGSPYQTRELLYRDLMDDRACAECTCGDPSGTCDGAKIQLVDSSDCKVGSNVVGSVPADGSCVQVSPAPALGAKQSGGVVTATCEPSPGQATGEAAPADPVTLCCL